MKRMLALVFSVLLVVSAVSCKEPTDNTSSLPVSQSPSSNIPSSNPSSSESSSSDDSALTDSSVVGPSSTPSTSRPENTVLPEEEENPSIHKDHYCYSKLLDHQKKYYEVMHDAVHNMQVSWILLGQAKENYKSDVAIVRNALASDHPDIFWLPSYYATALSTDEQGNSIVFVYFSVSADASPSYLVTNQEKEEMTEKLEKAVKEITDKVTATTPYEIELQLHNLLIERTQYSDDATDPMIYSAYGALVNKKALCEGYTRAMQLLLSRLGIESMVVTGVANNEGHMWNVVKIGQNWYHLDVTWNDMESTVPSYEYINLTDSQIMTDHSLNKNYDEFQSGELESGSVSFNIFRPACNSTEYNYYNYSGFVYTPDNNQALVDYIVGSSQNIVEVKFATKEFRDLFYNNTETYLNGINQTLASKYSDCGYYIGRITVGNTVLRLHKKETVY